MTTVQHPAFASPELQATLDKACKTLEGVEEARSRVSQDIKALESYLVNLRLTTPFRHPMGKVLVPDDEQNVAASLEFGGTASGKIREDALVLGEDAHGKVRLLYEISEWDGYVDVDVPGGPFFWESDTLQLDVKPLMETKFEIRKQVYKQLPAFVAALAGHYAIDPNQLTDWDDEIPF
ncbi:MAG: hypothetical protein KBA31_13025 [Alphaproteobacteria bacterium]|nr:hypothetical protein [Alphaproteobacteria bacterium]